MEKLTDIFKLNNIKSVTVLRMTVPCCGGLTWIVKEALKSSDKDITLSEKLLILMELEPSLTMVGDWSGLRILSRLLSCGLKLTARRN